MEKYRKNNLESGKASIIIILIIVVAIGGGIASNYIGSGKGWFDKISKDKKAPPTQKKIVKPPPPPPIEPAKPVIVEKPPETIEKKIEKEKKPEKSIKDIYDSLFEKYRKKFPDPEIGKKYVVYLKSGKTGGKLKSFSDGRITMQKPGVTVTYRLDSISKKSYPKLFPKKAAKILALKELKQILEKRAEEEEVKRVEQEYRLTKAGISASGSKAPKIKFAFAPKAQPTPKKLKIPLTAFANWVKVQQRRMGGKIGEKIYAKQQGRNVVLYMQTSKLFRKQSYDIRFSVTEGMWQIWGFKCIDFGTARAPSQTYIVLLDNRNRIIGGSSEDDASNIWVKK